MDSCCPRQKSLHCWDLLRAALKHWKGPSFSYLRRVLNSNLKGFGKTYRFECAKFWHSWDFKFWHHCLRLLKWNRKECSPQGHELFLKSQQFCNYLQISEDLGSSRDADVQPNLESSSFHHYKWFLAQSLNDRCWCDAVGTCDCTSFQKYGQSSPSYCLGQARFQKGTVC